MFYMILTCFEVNLLFYVVLLYYCIVFVVNKYLSIYLSIGSKGNGKKTHSEPNVVFVLKNTSSGLTMMPFLYSC